MKESLTPPLITLLFGSILTYFGIKAFIKKRKIENTPTSKIRSLAMGVVELNGSALSKKKLIAPMSQIPCVYYNAKIQEYRSYGKSGKYVTIAEETKGKKFFVQDESGKVLIDTKNAKIDVKTKHIYSAGISISGRQRMDELCERNKLSVKSFLGLRKPLRVIETWIQPHQGLYIFGEAINNPDVEDGSVEKNEDDIIITNSKNQKLLISDKTETEMIKKYFWMSVTMIPLGALIIAASIWTIFVMFGG